MYTLHKLSEGFIVTSDEKMVIKDTCYQTNYKNTLHALIVLENETQVKFANMKEGSFTKLKVIAQQHQLDFSALSEEQQREIGWFDVFELSKKNVEKIYSNYIPKDLLEDYTTLHQIGFKKAQELLSDRRFTLEDMVGFYYWLKKSYGSIKPLEEAQIVSRKTPTEIAEMYAQSIFKQSWTVELEMESIPISQNQGFNMKSMSSDFELQPKLTNGKVRILKLL